MATSHIHHITVGRRTRNTERGSRVGLDKRKRKEALRALFERKQQQPALSLQTAAAADGLPPTQVYTRWKQWQAATNDAERDAAISNKSGGHNRAFTTQQAQLLREQVLALPVATHEAVRSTALQLRQGVELAEQLHRQQHRSDPPVFTASPSFITRFKRTQRISSRRTKVVHVSKRSVAAPTADRDTEGEAFDYVTECADALLRYGPHLLLNMDETPAKLTDVPATALRETGSKEAAKIAVAGNERLNITTFPCISAAGDKLQMCAILKGKTQRCLRKIRNGANADVNKVRLYYSESGWINSSILVRWLHDVVQPYTQSRPAALILDDYPAHWTEEVQAAAAAMHLQLIKVPSYPGATAQLQPLDVQFNGPMKNRRTHIWTQKKQRDPYAMDSEQAVIERVQLAYAAMDKASVIEAFRKAQIPL
jgi:hypothetical protein